MQAESTTRICNRCGKPKPLSDFKTDKRKPLGKMHICKMCAEVYRNKERDRESVRRYYASDLEKSRARTRAIYQRNIEQRRQAHREEKQTPHGIVRMQFTTAVQRGTIVRPDTCSECGANGRIEGHHEDYSKPLEVVWLCSLCHGKRHRKYA